jgi:shikimate dehydrogenase
VAKNLGERLRKHYPNLIVRIGSNDPAGFDLVVNGTAFGSADFCGRGNNKK